MMNARIAAAVGLRIIALWFLLQGACGFLAYGYFRLTDRSAQVSPRETEVSKRATAVEQWRRHVIYTDIPTFVLGGILLLCAKPLGKLVALRLE
jgi:hypothetical protein